MNKKWDFLFQPVFFIASLIFATTLVLYIEKLSPSDFGKYQDVLQDRPKQVVAKTINERAKTNSTSLEFKRHCLKKVCLDFKVGKIDSVNLDRQLRNILETAEVSQN